MLKSRFKAQASVEFMIIFIFFTAALIMIMTITAQQIVAATDSRLQIESKKIINDASSRINIAFLEGPGFSINLILPNRVINYDYSIRIVSDIISLEIGDRYYYGSLLTGNITGSLVLTSGSYLVENKDGGIVIS